MTADGLKEQIGNLSEVLMLPWFSNSKFTGFKRKIEDLIKALQAYVTYLNSQSRKRAENHSVSFEEPLRSLRDTWMYRTVDTFVGPVKDQYGKLEEYMDTLEPYQFISMLTFEPDDRYERRTWLEHLGLKFPVALYSYQVGGNLRNLNFIWRLPSDTSKHNDDKMIAVVNQIQKEKPLYSTRAIRKQFVDHYIATGIKPAVLRNIFQFLTRDEASPESLQISKVDARVATWLASVDDPDLFYDLRQLNGRPENSLYNPFWEELGRFLEESCAVNDRRHNDTMYMPFCISVRDLKAKIVARLPENTPAPSLSWLRLNFSPNNQYANTALNYTGRFNVKYSVQQRLLRTEHEDSWYCGHLWKMMRLMAVMWQHHVQFLCVDDKAVVPVGEPGTPISTNVRAHHGGMVAADGPALAAADHDFHTCGVVPSVTFMVDVPSVLEDGFYSGAVNVTLKDKIFEPSSSMRHAGELVRLLRGKKELSQDGVNLDKPILMLYSDGGPDHRTNYVSVKVAAILVFVALDLDMYCAVRTAPHGSWANPAERIMSTLNLALQNVALSRDQMADPAFEKTMKGKSTMAAIRATAVEDPDFGAAVKESVKPVIRVLAERFSRLEYKEQALQTETAIEVAEILQFSNDIKDILDRNLADLTNPEEIKKFPTKSQRFKDFMKKHCRERHYSFQVRLLCFIQ
jgi:hypothetical protein